MSQACCKLVACDKVVPCKSAFTKVIPLKLFLDVVPSFSEDVDGLLFNFLRS